LVKRCGALDADSALILLLVSGLNLPYLADRIGPIHDTFPILCHEGITAKRAGAYPELRRSGSSHSLG